MTERLVFVYADLDEQVHLVGRLYAHHKNGKESASFEYDASWLENPRAYSLEPALMLGGGLYHTHKSLFGSLGDSAPDRWGRMLMKRAETKRAKAEERKAQTLYEMDYLMRVHDDTRAGALRFSTQENGPFQAQGGPPVPPLVSLPKLLAATDKMLDDKETADDLRLLLAPGSSLGGARPKASVIGHDGQLAIAKFPKKDDEYQAVEWEYVALELARRSGLHVPAFQLEKIAKRAVIILTRFDREGARRIPFLSAMSMLGASDHEAHSYIEIMDALRRYGAAPTIDGVELWRRIVFNILISNTDDHLRNHGFLYQGQDGWRLSPVYDVNPTPADIKERVLTTAIDEEDGTASLDLAMSVAEIFGISHNQARAIAGEIGASVNTWRDVANSLGLKNAEIERMASAFEHSDLHQACEMI